ncbi:MULTISPECIES: hypothetical protein [Methanobrevibacter]|jgi:hypothetical protein|uniref:hypothetical protein n=1 Tax=Methanobrevibacter TaxID=2172 RepID=UPI00037800B0|nr:hypothetical protein [Methanobrevibacter smithii]
MVKMLKKIVVNKPLNKEDETKINALLKTYETGTIEFYSSFSELHGQNLEITTLEEMEVQLTTDSLENLEQIEKEFDIRIREEIGDKVKILSSNIIH